MADPLSLPIENPRHLHLDWVLPVLFRPRQAFTRIAAQQASSWLTPLLILTLTALIAVAVAGPIKQEAARSGQVELPPDFQYYPPELQAQFQQAMAATQNPVFIYVFPALLAVGGVWAGWLIVGGLIHLALTLLGGRGATGSAMNLVAWAGLPFVIRDLVRAGYMLTTRRLIEQPGLAGFAPADDGGLALFLAALLALVDLYLLWHIVLLALGVRVASGLQPGKAIVGVIFVILLVEVIHALLRYFSTRLAGLTIIRPFF